MSKVLVLSCLMLSGLAFNSASAEAFTSQEVKLLSQVYQPSEILLSTGSQFLISRVELDTRLLQDSSQNRPVLLLRYIKYRFPQAGPTSVDGVYELRHSETRTELYPGWCQPPQKEVKIDSAFVGPVQVCAGLQPEQLVSDGQSEVMLHPLQGKAYFLRNLGKINIEFDFWNARPEEIRSFINSLSQAATFY